MHQICGGAETFLVMNSIVSVYNRPHCTLLPNKVSFSTQWHQAIFNKTKCICFTCISKEQIIWCVIFIDSHVELLFKPWKEFLFWIIHIICKANRAIICPLFRIVHYTCMRVLFCSLILRNDFKLLNIYEITLVSRFNALVNRQCALWGIVRIKAWKKL